MNTKKILAVMTCYNRMHKTINCIKRLTDNPDVSLSFVVVDDNSNDGTKEALHSLQSHYDIHVINGNGSLFYTGGMRKGLDYILKNEENYNYILLCNDDVEFYPGAISRIVKESEEKKAVIVGVCCSNKGNMTYSAVNYCKGLKIQYTRLPLASDTSADTFCANCVLIPKHVFVSVGNMDSHYSHSFGDFDYGFMIRKKGYNIFTSSSYVGICEWNSRENTWRDKKLSRVDRIRKKESIKGLPYKEWFYFLYKNFGLSKAVLFSITPYLRIILKR